MNNLFIDTTPDPAPEEGIVNVRYKNAAKANQTVTITIGDGVNDPQTFEVGLDGEGKVEIAFNIPEGWSSVHMNGPNSLEHVVSVTPK